MKTTADIVIIGGGIAGASTLYHLTERGIRDILLVEKEDRIASGTTAYTAGQVMLQVPDELHMRLSIATFDELQMLKDRFGVDVGFLKRGLITVDTEEHSDELHERAALQKSLGIPVEILSKDEIKARAPILNVEDIEIGLFCEKDGIIDANALVHAYVSLAKMSGAVVETGVRATNIVIHGGKVVGVETTRGFVSAPVVINAAGIHAREVGAWIGLDLPLANALRHIVYNVPIPIVPEDMPMLEVLNPVVIYIASRGKRPDYTIGTFPTDSFEHKPNLELMLDKHLDDLIYRVPALAMAGVESVIAGIRCATQDFFPILGPVDEISGYFNNCGWGGYGITNGPVGGVLVAECIAGKSELDISIEHFVLKRFQKN